MVAEPIDDRAVAISLIREALTLLDEPETQIAAEHLRDAIALLTETSDRNHHFGAAESNDT